MKIEYINFRDRAERAEYVANRFKRFLSGRIIDVGCDHATLKKLLSNIDYVGVDVGGDPDIQLNLEEIHYLLFNDRVFDCVVCTDVLEHLNNLHHIFGELIRVARGPIGRGKGSLGHYGLPADPPRDRLKGSSACQKQSISSKARKRNIRSRFLNSMQWKSREMYSSDGFGGCSIPHRNVI
jgi:SAM-dependent methyltransferase